MADVKPVLLIRLSEIPQMSVRTNRTIQTRLATGTETFPVTRGRFGWFNLSVSKANGEGQTEGLENQRNPADVFYVACTCGIDGITMGDFYEGPDFLQGQDSQQVIADG